MNTRLAFLFIALTFVKRMQLYYKNSKQNTNVKNARLLNEILFKSFLSKDDGGGNRPPEGVLDVLEILPGLFWLGEANPRFFVTTAQ